MNPKALIETKTFWIAVLQAAIGAIVVFSTAYPEAGMLVIAKSVLDVALRIYTRQPVTGVLKA